VDFGSIPLFGLMKSKLAYMSQRQSVLAQNIANADTPDYQARDIQTPNFKKMVSNASGKLQLKATNEKHFLGLGGSSNSSQLIKRDSTYERNPNGNNVVIEEEMAKVAENQAEYQKVLNIYRKSVDMFKTAIGKNNG